ncbi:MAG: tRNA (adenosine(37)-N6)-dimethylallyltransferase MiaA [Betaproteobacteria bacterium]|nr:tRNA (adenosine(37)-N6)-dimethylallyltransferase MiaA [Betaproteobacteria bacterium]
MGPTASGKSDLAMRLSKEFNGEIIAVDSATIYRFMDVGTAKPDKQTLEITPHHLINIIDPDQSYSAHQFALDAEKQIDEIVKRGKTPFLVGGTMLYFKSLLTGFNELPTADAMLRKQIDEEALTVGWPALHKRLMEVDETTALRLKENDSQRIQRALEVYQLTGRPLSSFHHEQKKNAWTGPVLSLALVPTQRKLLHQRIEARFMKMIELGLENELRQLRIRFNLHSDLPSMRCVGYRQMWQYLNNEIDYESMISSGIYATRQLAKRQLTWLKSWPNLVSLDPFEQETERNMLIHVERFISNHY